MSRPEQKKLDMIESLNKGRPADLQRNTSRFTCNFPTLLRSLGADTLVTAGGETEADTSKGLAVTFVLAGGGLFKSPNKASSSLSSNKFFFGFKVGDDLTLASETFDF